MSEFHAPIDIGHEVGPCKICERFVRESVRDEIVLILLFQQDRVVFFFMIFCYLSSVKA